MNNPAYKLLIEELEKYYPNLSTKFKLELPNNLFEVSYKKGRRVLSYMQVQEAGLFIVKGSALELSVDPNTLEERVVNFWFEKDFPYTKPGFFGEEPSPSYIQLLEDTLFVGIHFHEFSALRQDYAEMNILIEKIRGHYDKLRHIMEEDFRFPANRRVKRLELAHPNIYNLADIKHIAEYHRISVKTLSRLRNK